MSKLTDLTAQTTVDDADLSMVVDVSDTSMDVTGTNKKITWANIKATLKTYLDTLYATTSQANATHTGDVTGATALTLATVNSDVGSFTNANITVNAKGLITAASNGSGGGSLTVGTSTITSGTTTRVLYDNAGVLGEYTVSGSGNVAMTTSPVFTTPNIGNATGSITGNAGTATTLATPRTIGTLTGDVTTAGSSFDGSANNTNATVLATVNSNVGSFGSATQVGTFTVNAKGLVTAASNVTVTPAVGSITGLGTGVGTALAVNVGTAGAPVVNGGALGTPSSGTVTNLTGTASININGTVGATTPTTGSFTTVTTSGNIELGNASDTTLARVAAGIVSVEGEVMNGYATTATAAGTTTLTITSAKTQYFTGTSTQTVKLPTTSVILGQSYIISNQSTGSVTVQSSGANTIQILGAGMTATFVANTATPTTAAHWNYSMIEYVGLNNAITASSNAATINLAYKTNTVTNNSAATLTITLPTAGAIDGEMRVVRVLDFSAVAQTITWVNTENSTVTAPTTSNGSTTLPLTIGFQYNNGTSKWRCIASC